MISSKHLSDNATGTKQQPRHRNPRHQSQPESTAGREAGRHGNIPNHTRARILQPSPSLETSGTILDDQTLQTLPSSLLHYLTVDDDEGPRSTQTQISPPPRRVVASFFLYADPLLDYAVETTRRRTSLARRPLIISPAYLLPMMMMKRQARSYLSVSHPCIYPAGQPVAAGMVRYGT
ncbi:hypothetical protein BKA81DRAFT_353900 [Phyllosticta paracitricarpa]